MMNSVCCKENVRNHLNVADKATRTTQLRAVAAHLYGDAMLMQCEMAYSGEVDGGQEKALALADACVEVINAPMLDVQDLFKHVETLAQEFLDYLDSIS